MDHLTAQSIFKEIQDRPYRLSVVPDDHAQNCFFKNIELIQQLGILGYTVRGRLADTYWNPEIFPKEILDLQPDTMPDKHFYAEIFLDNEWRILDPSFQPSLEQYGFVIGSWDNGESCFPLTKIYTQEEEIAFQKKWSEPAYINQVYQNSEKFWKALDHWFSKRS